MSSSKAFCINEGLDQLIHASIHSYSWCMC